MPLGFSSSLVERDLVARGDDVGATNLDLQVDRTPYLATAPADRMLANRIMALTTWVRRENLLVDGCADDNKPSQRLLSILRARSDVEGPSCCTKEM